MGKRLAWIALAVALGFAIRAFAVENLFGETLWIGDAVTKLLVYIAIYWAVASAILWLRPAWLFPVAAIFILLYSEWWCARFFSAWAPVVVLYFLGSCCQLGRLLFRSIDAVLATLLGLAVWILLISIAVHFAVNKPVVYAVAFAIPYALRPARPKISSPSATAGHALLLFVLMMQWLIALEPEIGADALSMHLAVPAMIARDGRFAFDFGHYAWALMPMGGDFAFAGVYLLGGEAAARLLNFAMLALIVAMIYKASLRWLSPGRAALAAALFASTPLVELVTGSLFVENVWAAFLAGSCLALWTGEVTAAAILFGAAFATKLGTSAYLAPAIAMAWVALRKQAHRAKVALAAVALLLLFAAPPYLYAWARTRNPVFPFANGFFRSPDFSLTASLADLRYQQNHDWNALYDLTFRSAGFIEGQGGALGFQYFLLLAPLLLLLRRKAPLAPILFGVAGAVITFVSIPNLRYLYPALAPISIGLAWLLCEMPALAAAFVAILAFNVWFLPAAGWTHREFALFTRAQVDQYLAASAPQRKLIDILNRVAPGEPVAFLGGDPIAGLHATAYSDQWRTYSFSKRYRAAQDAAQVAELVHESGIHYVIAPPRPETKVEQHFLEDWTAPTGYVSNHWEVRRVVDTRIVRPREMMAQGPGTYDDLDETIEYSGSWLHDRQFAGTAGQSITYSNRPGDTARFFFNGRSITYIYTKAFNRGIAEIAIDGKPRGRLDLFSRQIMWQQKSVFAGLADGPHTLELRVTGSKNPQSADDFVDLDEFIVEY